MKKLIALVISASLIASPFAFATCKCAQKHHKKHSSTQSNNVKTADPAKNDTPATPAPANQ